MLISVCIPTFNQGRYLEQCIRSVMAQSLKPDEIIVSNDCSSDDTKEILDRLAKEINIIKIVHQDTNLGMVKNTNFCLSSAKYDIIVKLDSDDYLLPEYIETLFTLLCKYPQAGYAHAAVQEINEYDIKVKQRRLFRKTGFQNNEEALKSSCNGYQVAANIIMFKKAALIAAGFITSKVKFAEDFYLSVELADAGFGNVYSEKVLSCYRVWSDEGNVRQRRKLNEINGIRIIFDEPIKSSFAKRNWNMNLIEKKKQQFACVQSNCLMWSIYNKEEKDELESAIYDLSSTNKVRLHVYLYRNGLGSLIMIPSNIMHLTKQLAKSILKKIY
jgi:glycosyltransferase involved in cell wall biosynthesis